MTIIDMM